jgi:hypothetical protein
MTDAVALRHLQTHTKQRSETIMYYARNDMRNESGEYRTNSLCKLDASGVVAGYRAVPSDTAARADTEAYGGSMVFTT